MKIYSNLVTLLFSFLMMCMYSCRSTRQVTHHQKEKELVTVQKEVYKDTVIVAPKAQTSLIVPLEDLVDDNCHKNPTMAFQPPTVEYIHDTVYVGKVYKPPSVVTSKNGHATATLKKIGNVISVDCVCDTLAIEAKFKKEYESKNVVEKDTQHTEIKKRTGVSYLKLILYVIASLCVGFVVGFFLKTFKII